MDERVDRKLFVIWSGEFLRTKLTAVEKCYIILNLFLNLRSSSVSMLCALKKLTHCSISNSFLNLANSIKSANGEIKTLSWMPRNPFLFINERKILRSLLFVSGMSKAINFHFPSHFCFVQSESLIFETLILTNDFGVIKN